MLKAEKVDVWGFEHAIRGMRNPMNSWEKSDSNLSLLPTSLWGDGKNYQYKIGENDLRLMKKLSKAGTEHRKYLRQIMVSMDIIAPLYWWSEMDTYKVGTTANSCSKMHKLLSKSFEVSDFSFDQLPGYRNEIVPFIPELSEEEIASELWKLFEEDYQVSNLGRVRHLLKSHYRILGGSKHQDGYIFVTIRGKQFPVHRIVAEAFCLKHIEDTVVNHKDGNKQNNKACNLEWVTQSENVKHSYDNKLQPKSVSTYKGKFTEEARNRIKSEWNEGSLSKRKLAEKYGVSHTCINDIINDKYKYADKVNVFKEAAIPLVDVLNELRDSYFNTENLDEKKQIWYSILQLLPSSYNQRRTVTMNYENVFTIIKQRSGHKLDEWRELINVLEQLPYVKEIIGE